jgi:hypothetical protein
MGRGPKAKRRKPAVKEPQPLDAFEADDQLPAEEQPKNVNKRYDVSCCSWGSVSVGCHALAVHTRCTDARLPCPGMHQSSQ